MNDPYKLKQSIEDIQESLEDWEREHARAFRGLERRFQALSEAEPALLDDTLVVETALREFDVQLAIFKRRLAARMSQLVPKGKRP